MNSKGKSSCSQVMDDVESLNGLSNGFIVKKALGKSALTCFALFCFSLVSACSSNYTITTIKGESYRTQGAPEFVDGGYSFRDTSGAQHHLYVAGIKEVTNR